VRAKTCLEVFILKIQKIMGYSFHLGIDMSKKSFDFCLLDGGGTILNQGRVANEKGEIREWAEVLGDDFGGAGFWGSCLVCMEHSGYYGAHLLEVLGTEVDTGIWLENALRIKRSFGLQRGKSDRADAARIAAYCLDKQRNARLWAPRPANIERLGLLLSHRDRMVKGLMSLRNTLNEEEGYVPDGLHGEMAEVSAPAIAALEAAVGAFDAKIGALLESDTVLARQAEIVTSIPGFGPVIAPKLIEVTHGFTRLTDPRAFACFAGVAPFEHSSGTSIKGKTRVSHLADKDIKKNLSRILHRDAAPGRTGHHQEREHHARLFQPESGGGEEQDVGHQRREEQAHPHFIGLHPE
jgi:transposase